jgi:hypothetical protein
LTANCGVWPDLKRVGRSVTEADLFSKALRDFLRRANAPVTLHGGAIPTGHGCPTVLIRGIRVICGASAQLPNFPRKASQNFTQYISEGQKRVPNEQQAKQMNRRRKTEMQDKTKKAKKEIKVRDLKPPKDPRGGYAPGPPDGPGRSGPRPNMPPGPST